MAALRYEIFLQSRIQPPLGEGVLPYIRYMPPQRVLFLSHFGPKTGIDFDHYGPKSGMIFKGTMRAYKRICFFQFQVNKREREITKMNH